MTLFVINKYVELSLYAFTFLQNELETLEKTKQNKARQDHVKTRQIKAIDKYKWELQT